MREESYHFLEKKNYFKKIHLDEVLFSRYSSKFPNPISKYPLNRKHERILCHAISRQQPPELSLSQRKRLLQPKYGGCIHHDIITSLDLSSQGRIGKLSIGQLKFHKRSN